MTIITIKFIIMIIVIENDKTAKPTSNTGVRKNGLRSAVEPSTPRSESVTCVIAASVCGGPRVVGCLKADLDWRSLRASLFFQLIFLCNSLLLCILCS